jgi:hypothetical protein
MSLFVQTVTLTHFFFGAEVPIYLFIHIQIPGVTQKCKPGTVYSGFCRRTNKKNQNPREEETGAEATQESRRAIQACEGA